MTTFLTPLFGAFLALIFGSANHSSVPGQTKEAWTCQQPTWVGNPSVKNGMFVGTLNYQCRVEGLSGKGMLDLQQHMVTYVQENAETVHSGPIAETYMGMQSYYLDATMQMGDKDESVLVRADTHSATDGSTQFHYAVISKTVAGTGNAKALKKIDGTYMVTPTTDAGFYNVVLSSTAQVQKPSLVPSGLFFSQVKSEMEKQLKASAPEALTEISNHL